MKLSFARLNQKLSGLELELLGADGLRYGDWTMVRPDRVDFYGRDAGYRYLRAKGNSIEGRHVGDPQEHRGGAGAGPAAGAPGRQGPALEGRAQVSFTPQLLLTDVEDDLRAAVRDLLGRRVAPSDLIAAYDGTPCPPCGPSWPRWVSRGCWCPRSSAVRGAGAAVAGVVAEELGAACAPGPFLTSAGSRRRSCCPPGRTTSRPSSPSGERTAALVVPFSADPHAPVPDVPVADGALSGTVRSVAGAIDAGVLLVPGSDGALYAVAASDARIEPVPSLDMTRQVADVTFDGAPGSVLAADGAAAVPGGDCSPVRRSSPPSRPVLRAGAWRAPSEYLSSASSSGEWSAASRRSSTGSRSCTPTPNRLPRPRGRAPLAVTELGTEGSGIGDRGGRRGGILFGPRGCAPAEEAVQLHGGIGMTWEAPVHLYLKRAKADQIGLGAPGRHRAALAGLIDLPA